MRAGRRHAAWWIVAAALPAAVACSRPATTEPRDQPQHRITVQMAGRAEYDRVIRRHQGRVVLVDFWATWCDPCRRQFPHTVKMARKYADRGLAVVSVSLDDPGDKEQVLDFLRKQNATFDNLISRFGLGSESMTVFEIDGGVPHYKLYDRRGKLRETFSPDPRPDHQFTPEDVDRRVQELLAEE